MESKIKHLISYIAWPGLLVLCMAIMAYGFTHGQPVLYFNFAYVVLIVTLFFLERWMPHEREWTKPDGQTLANILHTLSSKGHDAIALAVRRYLWVDGVDGRCPSLAFGRAAGRWRRRWCSGSSWRNSRSTGRTGWGMNGRFCGISTPCITVVTKLWIVNTGRFHFVDSLYKIVPSVGLLCVLGAPHVGDHMAVSAFTGFIGMLTHCNVEMRFGPLSWIFNTPELTPLAPQQGFARGEQELLRERDRLGSDVWHLFPRKPPPPAGRYRHSRIHAAAFRSSNHVAVFDQEGKRQIEAGCRSIS